MVLLWRLYLLLYGCLLWQVLLAQEKFFKVKLDSNEEVERALLPLKKVCIENSISQKIPFYLLCFYRSIFEIDYDFKSNAVTETQILGHYLPEESLGSTQVYLSAEENCRNSDDFSVNRTKVSVRIECCHAERKAEKTSSHNRPAGSSPSPTNSVPSKFSSVVSKAFIHSVGTPDPCSFHITVCSELICAPLAISSSSSSSSSSERSVIQKQLAHIGRGKVEEYSMTAVHQLELRNRTREMFYHAYSSYLENAFPEGELKPVSCEGGPFELIKIPFVTLIDTLDTLVIMGDHSEFRRVSQLLIKQMPNFDFDVNVSLFETTIRILGGLLSAHLFSVDPTLGIYGNHSNSQDDPISYNNEFLVLAVDLGDRLMPAFATKTGIPFGTVNLRHGVPKGETKIASTAGAGTLLMEFEILSILTGQEKYGKAAFVALEGIYSRKSDFDLVGKHINTETGQWLETLSGVGSNSDSFYEYLLKGYSLLQHFPLYQMFSKTYRAIKRMVLIDDEWFSEVDMYSGKLQRRRVENLDAFWPGMEAILGNPQSASLQLNALYSISSDLGFLPEELDQPTWEAGKGATNPHYALRPELIESTYYQYQVTGHRSWLTAGKQVFQSIEKYTRTGCGFASINDVTTLELHDSMPSFFLSETCKYMYLLFDEDNFFHRRPYLLSTEAHPFDLNQLYLIKREQQRKLQNATETVAMDTDVSHSLLALRRQRRKRIHKSKFASANPPLPSDNAQLSPTEAVIPSFPSDDFTLSLKCPAPSFFSLTASTFMKIHLKRDGSKVKRSKPLFTSVNYLEEENSNDETSQTSNRVVSYRRNTLSKSLKNLITLLEYRKKISNWSFSLRGDHRRSDDSSTDSLAKKCPTRSSASILGDEQNRVPTSIALKDSSNSVLVTSSSVEMASDGEQFMEEMPAMKTLELSLGSLGQFKIKVFADGFRISNKQEERSLEISNVGKKTIFLRELDPEGMRSMMGRSSGTVHSCTVEALTDDDGDKGHSIRWQRHCAMANFGPAPPIHLTGELLVAEQSQLGRLCGKKSSEPQSQSAATDMTNLIKKSLIPISQSAIAALFEKGDSLLTNKLTWWKKLKEASLLQFGGKRDSLNEERLIVSNREEEKEESAVEREPLPLQGNDNRETAPSLQHSSTSSRESFPSESSECTGGEVNLRRKIVLAKRGDCLFEEKSMFAQEHGGIGVIVQNRENNLFIMAGKKDVEDLSADLNTEIAKAVQTSSSTISNPSDNPVPADTSAPHAEEVKVFLRETVQIISSSSPVKIPTVMLTDRDGADLIALEQMQTQRPLQLSLHIQSLHSILITDLFGNQQFPKVWMTKTIIYVYTKGLWAAYFKTQKGDDWQMYLIDKRDPSSLRLIPPMTVRNREGAKLSTTSTLMQPPEQIYSLLLRRKCTKNIKVSNRDRYIQMK